MEPESGPGDALLGSVVGGRYRIETLLGQGGMGAVYRAEQLDLKKKVAVKLLHRDMVLNAEVVARFEREAVAGGRITHPHVASAFDFGRLDNGVYYLALEYVEGKSLGRIMHEMAPFPELMALRITRQIADALAAAHEAGVVHRDLKPENVMLLDRPGGEEFVKVLDFGIAKLRSTGSDKDQPLTQLGTVFGTPEYMSPEQARGMEVDGRSDLYTLGLMLYEMLSGASPFSHEDVVVILARQLSMQPPPLSERVSRPTRELVNRLLHKDRDLRPAGAVEVREALDALLAKLEAGRDRSAPSLELGGEALARNSASRVETTEDAPTLLALPRGDAAPAQVAAADSPGSPATRHRASMVPLFGYAFPRRALYAFAALIALSTLLTLVLLRTHEGGPRALLDPTVAATSREKELAELSGRAETGDRVALATLGVVPAAERSPAVWRALSLGHCRGEDGGRCLELLREAAAAVPALAVEPELVATLRRLLRTEAHGPAALELAAGGFGARGVDLLYELGADKTTPKVLAQQARELLQQERVQKVMSSELAAALRLAAAFKAPRCGELKRLLGELGPAFDQRALSSLNRLNERRGCGLLGLGDCYSCLRGGRELKTALEAARARPAPRLEPEPEPAATAPATSTRPGRTPQKPR